MPPPRRCTPTPPSSPQEHLPADKLAQVKGVLYGLNCGKPVAAVPLPPALSSAAAAGGYDLQVGCCLPVVARALSACYL